MTNNNITPNDRARIAERVQGRDIEKMFDQFIENMTDTVIEDLGLDMSDDDVMMAYIDEIIDQGLGRFNYALIDPDRKSLNIID